MLYKAWNLIKWLFSMPILKRGGTDAVKNDELLKVTAKDLGTEAAVCLDMQKPLTLHDRNNFLLKSNKPWFTDFSTWLQNAIQGIWGSNIFLPGC